MDFGIFYEIQVDSPLKHREREYQAFHDVMAQVVRAEEVGFTNFWTVEHHFQVGFAHSSAPEVLYGAISQRTSRFASVMRWCCCRFPTTIRFGSPSASRRSTSRSAPWCRCRFRNRILHCGSHAPA